MNIIRENGHRIKKEVEQRLPWMVDLLGRLVELESPSKEPESHGPLLSVLAEEFALANMETKLLPGKGRSGGMLFGQSRSFANGGPTQLMVGHADTVWPIGTLKNMPFRVEGDLAKGPGVFDMKAGIVQMLAALASLQSLNLTPSASPLVLINTDEEIGSTESRSEIERLAEICARVFVLEPALGLEGRLKTTRKGSGRFDILIRGKSAHAGLAPDEGASAIVELSHVIQALNDLNDAERGITVNVGEIGGGMSANIIAPTSTASVDVRVPTRVIAQEIEAKIHAISPTTPGTQIAIDGGFSRPPLESTSANTSLKALAYDVSEVLGIKISDGTAGGGSDGNYTSIHTATLDGLGAVGDGAHAEHEFIYIDKMVERSALLAGLLLAPTELDASMHDKSEHEVVS